MQFLIYWSIQGISNTFLKFDPFLEYTVEIWARNKCSSCIIEECLIRTFVGLVGVDPSFLDCSKRIRARSLCSECLKRSCYIQNFLMPSHSKKTINNKLQASNLTSHTKIIIRTVKYVKRIAVKLKLQKCL